MRVFVAFCAQATQDFLSRNSMQMAAAIAFYSFFSLFPLSLLIVLGYDMLGGGRLSAEVMVRVVGAFIPVSSEEIIRTIREVALTWDWRATGPLALAGLVWGSTAVFATVRKGINATWGIFTPRPFLRERVIDLTVTACAGMLFMVLLHTTTVLRSVAGPALLGGPTGQLFAALPPTFFTFSFMYWFMLNRSIRLRDVLFGALVAAIAFEGAKAVFFLYSSKREVLNQVYGSLTSVAVLLGWLYLSAAIVLIGSLVCHIYVGLLQERIATATDIWTLGLAALWRRLSGRKRNSESIGSVRDGSDTPNIPLQL